MSDENGDEVYPGSFWSDITDVTGKAESLREALDR